MGANMSSVDENRAPFSTITHSPPLIYPPKTYTMPSPSLIVNPCPLFPETTLAPAPPPPQPATSVGPTNPSSTTATGGRVVAFHSATSWRAYFQASKACNKLIVIDFTATWCKPCRSMEPIVDEFAAKYIDVEFVKIDVDELFNISSEFGVQAMPTFLFIKKGKKIDKVVGTKKDELQMKINKYKAY